MWRLSLTPLTWPGLAVVSIGWAALLLLREQPVSALWPLLTLLAWPLWRRQTLLVLLAALLGCWMAWAYQHSWAQRITAPVQDWKVSGVIVGAPQHSEGGNAYFAFRTQDDNPGLLRVAWYRDAPDLRQGDCWILRLRVRPPHGHANPGGLDYESWLFREGYAGKASVRAGEPCGRSARDWRERWAEQLQGFGRPRASATLRALLLGDRRGLDDQDWDILRRTGTTHLFAISGLHLGLIAGFGWLLGISLWKLVGVHLWPRARDWGALGAVVFAVGYAWVSGFGLPVQRALIMCLFGLLALLSGRQRQAFQILALAFVLVVAVNPLSMLMPGLWLSFVAAGGILVYLHCHPTQSRLVQLFGIQLMLAALLLPLSALLFGGVSLLGASVNLLLVPLFGLLLPVLLLASVIQLGAGWAAPLDWALQLLQALWSGLESVASWPAAYLTLAQPGLVWTALATLGVVLWIPSSRFSRVLGTFAILPLLLVQPARPDHGDLRLWVWDVGQGQSVLVQTAEHDLLYDAGPAWGGFDAAQRLLVPALRALGLRRLDGMMISHGDSDHAGGAQTIVDAFKPALQWGDPAHPCRAGQRWQWDGVDFAVLHPVGDSGSDNNRSCVLLLRSASGHQVLLPGDIEASAERDLLARYPDLRADVLVVPHHGSTSSSSAPFVEQLRPQHALVSAGWHNRWGFPAQPVVERYRQAAAKLHVSGESGAIRVDVDEQLDVRSWRALHPRLWRDFSDSGAP